MVIKHSTTHNPNDIVPSADWNADHTGTTTPEDHGNEAHTPNFLSAESDPVFIAWDKDHVDLSNVTSDQHHSQSHTLASHSTKAHTELTGVTSDQHHAQSHNAASHSDITSTGANIDDAVSKRHTQNTDTALGAQSENLDMNTHKIVGVVDPAANQDAATKKYVDDKVAIVKGTHYWSSAGSEFNPARHVDQYLKDVQGLLSIADDQNFTCDVELPNGAVVTGAVVYGSDAGNTWQLRKCNISAGGSVVMATAAHGTEDTTITDATINNSAYTYLFWTPISNGDLIFGARITYTL